MPISMEQAQQQREYIYSQLELKINACPFRLLKPVHQISAALDYGIDHAPRFCHGFSEYWANLVQNGMTDHVEADEHLMPLTAEVIRLQKQVPLRYNIKKFSYNLAKLFPQQGQLIDYIIGSIYDPELCGSTMVVLGLASLPSTGLLHQYSFLTSSFSWLIPSWHQTRVFIDKKMFVHWFDANIGWFKSRQANPTKQDLRQLLTMLFDILQYETYQICAVYDRFTNKPAPRIKILGLS